MSNRETVETGARTARRAPTRRQAARNDKSNPEDIDLDPVFGNDFS